MSDEPKSGPEYALDRMREFLKSIEDHVGSCRVFITFPSPHHASTTGTTSLGLGDYYAQYGSVREWLVRQESVMRSEATDEEP